MNELEKKKIDQEIKTSKAKQEAAEVSKTTNIIKAILVSILCISLIGLVVFAAFKINKTMNKVDEGIDDVRNVVKDTSGNVNGVVDKLNKKDGILDKTEDLLELKNKVEETLDSANGLIRSLSGK